MRTLKRPMFNKGGSTNEGIMTGLVDRSQYAGGGTIGGGTIQGTPMGYRTGFATFAPIGSTIGKTAFTGTEGLIGQGMAAELADSPAKLKAIEKIRRFNNLRNMSLRGTSAAGALPVAYVGLASMLQSSLPDELKSIPNFAYGKTGIYDRAGYADPMSAGADISPEVDKILREADSKEARINKYNPLGEGRKDPMGSGFYDTPIEQGGALTKEAEEKRKIKILSDKIGEGSVDDIKIKETIADKRSRLSKRAKEFMDILAPEAQKRAVVDSLAAASEALGKSTGDTKQDIAGAITAAAKVGSSMRDINLMARKLAIQEDIEKGLKKDTKDSVFAEKTKAYVEAYPQAEGESAEDYKARILGMVKERADDDWRALKLKYVQQFGRTQGPIKFVRDYYNRYKDYGGIIAEGLTPKLVDGKKYYDAASDQWVIYKNGKPSSTTPPGE